MIKKIIALTLMLFLTGILVVQAIDQNKEASIHKIVDSKAKTIPEPSTPAIGISIGQIAPNIKGTAINGKMINLSSLKGKKVMINFWATWCPPCRNKMLALESLHREMANSNFMIIAVNIDENSSVAREFIQRNGYTFPVVLDENREIAAQYSVRSIPTTYIIDPRGRIAGVITGSRDWSSSETIKILRELSM